MKSIFIINTEAKSVHVVFLFLIIAMVFALYLLVLNPLESAKGGHNSQINLANNTFEKPDKALDHLVHNERFKTEFKAKSYQDLHNIFSLSEVIIQNEYNRNLTIPRLYLVSLPKNFNKASINSKKKLFIKSLLPLILKANENILINRQYLLKLIEYRRQGLTLTLAQKKWLTKLGEDYRLRKFSIPELLKRVDVIPPSLALSQAIVETGWGSSYSALQKNATFGMRSSEHVLVYDSLMESVENYMRTINSHSAYNEMRTIRSKLRSMNQELCSVKMAKGLINYSERKQAYTRDVADLINRYNLKKYDTANLTKRI